MAHVITDDCTCCGSCIDECAFEAISEGDSKYAIDADVCTDCGVCVDACSSDAIIEG
jgi:heterodisulfide reductase subunit A-like polyferredoxin